MSGTQWHHGEVVEVGTDESEETGVDAPGLLAVVTVVLTLLVWSVLDKVGLVASMSSFLESIAGAQGAQLVAGLTFGNVMTFTLVVSLLEVIVVSALGAIFAALFNLATNVVGGWKVTFGSD